MKKQCEHLCGYCKNGFDICGDCGAIVGGNGEIGIPDEVSEIGIPDEVSLNEFKYEIVRTLNSVIRYLKAKEKLK